MKGTLAIGHEDKITYASALTEGIRLFEAGAYWETHEVLERAWLGQRGVDRRFLGGLILLAAALLKAGAGRPRAARTLYARGLAHLAWVPDRFAGVAVRVLERRVLAALSDPAARRPAVPRVGEDLE